MIDNHLTLYLSREGDCVDILGSKKDALPIQEQIQASACKTHEHVLHFLEGLRNSEILDRVTLMHSNNPYFSEHKGDWPTGLTHACPLENQIKFLKDKISDTKPSVTSTSGSCCVIQ